MEKHKKCHSIHAHTTNSGTVIMWTHIQSSTKRRQTPQGHIRSSSHRCPTKGTNAEGDPQTLRQACYREIPESAMCVQNLNDSRGLAIRITYRISLRSSSLWEPRHPPLKVVRYNVFRFWAGGGQWLTSHRPFGFRSFRSIQVGWLNLFSFMEKRICLGVASTHQLGR